MQKAVWNNLILIGLMAVSVWKSPFPQGFVALTGLFLVLLTWGYFIREEALLWTRLLRFLCWGCFAVCSGTFWGFAALAVIEDGKALYRGMAAAGGYLLYAFLILQGQQPATVLVSLLLLVLCFAVICGVQSGIAGYQSRQHRDAVRLKTTNISELHTRQMNEQLIRMNYMADKNARLMERENISRNIHNSVGHSITAAIMTLDAADLLYEVRPEEARKKMKDANERIRGSLDSIRRAVRILDEESREVSAADLKCEFANIRDNFMMDTDRRVSTYWDELPDELSLPHEHAEFLTGVLEELLSNGVRHGHADEFAVLLQGDEGHIRLVVSDNGSSDFNEQNSGERIGQGFGLKKITAYTEKCGGRAEFVNQDGFRVTVELPIYEDEKQ